MYLTSNNQVFKTCVMSISFDPTGSAVAYTGLDEKIYIASALLNDEKGKGMYSHVSILLNFSLNMVT